MIETTTVFVESDNEQGLLPVIALAQSRVDVINQLIAIERVGRSACVEDGEGGVHVVFGAVLLAANHVRLDESVGGQRARLHIGNKLICLRVWMRRIIAGLQREETSIF